MFGRSRELVAEENPAADTASGSKNRFLKKEAKDLTTLIRETASFSILTMLTLRVRLVLISKQKRRWTLKPLKREVT